MSLDNPIRRTSEFWARTVVFAGLLASCTSEDGGDPAESASTSTSAGAPTSASAGGESSTGDGDSTSAEPSEAALLVDEHLRSIEAGDWDGALADLDEDFMMTGLAPVPIPKAQAMMVHKLRKQALPDFQFNETVLGDDGETVKLEVRITGTHLGVFDYRAIGFQDVVEPTCKAVDLPAEYFDFTVRDGKIVAAVGNIPEGAGPGALLEQIGPPPYGSECDR